MKNFSGFYSGSQASELRKAHTQAQTCKREQFVNDVVWAMGNFHRHFVEHFLM